MFSWDPNDHKGLQSDWTEASWVHSILLQKLYRKKKDWNAWTQISTGAILSIALCSCWSQTPACMTIANWSEGRLSLNVGIVSIPPDTSALHLQLLSCPLCPKGSPWPSLYCLGWNTICRDHPASSTHILITLFLVGLTHLIKQTPLILSSPPPWLRVSEQRSKVVYVWMAIVIIVIILIINPLISSSPPPWAKVKGSMYEWQSPSSSSFSSSSPSSPTP